jgi:hypothetical protein
VEGCDGGGSAGAVWYGRGRTRFVLVRNPGKRRRSCVYGMRKEICKAWEVNVRSELVG